MDEAELLRERLQAITVSPAPSPGLPPGGPRSPRKWKTELSSPLDALCRSLTPPPTPLTPGLPNPGAESTLLISANTVPAFQTPPGALSPPGWPRRLGDRRSFSPNSQFDRRAIQGQVPTSDPVSNNPPKS